MKLIQSASILPIVFLLISISACSTTPATLALSKDRISSIKSISIDRNVPKPKEIFFRGGLQGWSAVLLGPIGAAATEGAALDAGAQLVSFMDKNKIDISEIVLTEFEMQIKNKPFPIVTGSENYDAKFELAIDRYGFNKTQPFGSNMNPLIRVTGRLVTVSGEILWQRNEFVSDMVLENDQGQSLETYYKEPEKLKLALQCAAKVAVTRIVMSLDGSPYTVGTVLSKPCAHDNALRATAS